MKILNGKFEIVGTKAKSPVWDPVSKQYIDLKKIDNTKAGELIVSGFPFLKAVTKSEEVDLTKLVKKDLIQLAEDKGVDLGDAKTNEEIIQAIEGAAKD